MAIWLPLTTLESFSRAFSRVRDTISKKWADLDLILDLICLLLAKVQTEEH